MSRTGKFSTIDFPQRSLEKKKIEPFCVMQMELYLTGKIEVFYVGE